MRFTIDTIGREPEAAKAVEAAPINPRELEELGRLRAQLPAGVDDVDDDDEVML